MKVSIFEKAGDFAEDKDVAAQIRESAIRPAVTDRQKITLDFAKVTLVTQSFVHALISDVLRSTGDAALRYIVFKSCNSGTRGIVETVVQYSLEPLDEAAPTKVNVRSNKRMQRTASKGADRSRRGRKGGR